MVLSGTINIIQQKLIFIYPEIFLSYIFCLITLLDKIKKIVIYNATNSNYLKTTIMEKDISQKTRQEIISYLEEKLLGKAVLVSDKLIHIKALHNEDRSGFISFAKNKNQTLQNTNVLYELETHEYALKFVFVGDFFLTSLLWETFGGEFVGLKFWVLYNTPQKYNPFGYSGQEAPTADKLKSIINNFSYE